MPETILFQSTLPVRGATPRYGFPPVPRQRFQSTLPVRGATETSAPPLPSKRFQSTLPVRGATDFYILFFQAMVLFQSTLPVRGATDPVLLHAAYTDISIHAPREGSDYSFKLAVWSP